MHPSTVARLRLKPILPSQTPTTALRLPPRAARPRSAKSKQQSQDTLVARLASQKLQYDQQASADPDAKPWPENLRIEEHIPGKSLYWKVPKEQRDLLRKELKEA